MAPPHRSARSVTPSPLHPNFSRKVKRTSSLSIACARPLDSRLRRAGPAPVLPSQGGRSCNGPLRQLRFLEFLSKNRRASVTNQREIKMARGCKPEDAKTKNDSVAHLGFQAQPCSATDKLRCNLKPCDCTQVASGLTTPKRNTDFFQRKRAALPADEPISPKGPDEQLAEHVLWASEPTRRSPLQANPAAQILEEPIRIANRIRATRACGKETGFSKEDIAFYYALEKRPANRWLNAIGINIPDSRHNRRHRNIVASSHHDRFLSASQADFLCALLPHPSCNTGKHRQVRLVQREGWRVFG